MITKKIIFSDEYLDWEVVFDFHPYYLVETADNFAGLITTYENHYELTVCGDGRTFNNFIVINDKWRHINATR